MSDLGFSGVVIVAAVAFAAPLLLGLVPAVPLPAVVLELLAGIAIGPSGLGWVELDEPIEVLSLVGLAFLLFPPTGRGDPRLRGARGRVSSRIMPATPPR